MVIFYNHNLFYIWLEKNEFCKKCNFKKLINLFCKKDENNICFNALIEIILNNINIKYQTYKLNLITNVYQYIIYDLP